MYANFMIKCYHEVGAQRMVILMMVIVQGIRGCVYQ